MLKIKISTSVWSERHPNAGRNIQQVKTRPVEIWEFILSEINKPQIKVKYLFCEECVNMEGGGGC